MTDTVPIGLIVVRLTQPVKNYPVGTELGYKDVADAIAALGSAHYFEVVRDQAGNPIPPLTPEEIEEAQRAAQRRAKSRRLILGADFDPLWDRVDGIPSATELEQMRQDVDAVADVPPRVEAVETALSSKADAAAVQVVETKVARVDPGEYAGAVGESLAQGPDGPAWREGPVSADWFSDLNDALTLSRQRSTTGAGHVVLSAGVNDYATTGGEPLRLRSGDVIEGADPSTSRIVNLFSGATAVAVDSPGTLTDRPILRNLRVYGANQSAIGVDWRGITRGILENVEISGFLETQLWFGGDAPAYGAGWSNIVRTARIEAAENGSGIRFSGETDTGVSTANRNSLYDVRINGLGKVGSIGVDLQQGDTNTFFGGDIGYGTVGVPFLLGPDAYMNRFIGGASEGVSIGADISGQRNVFVAWAIPSTSTVYIRSGARFNQFNDIPGLPTFVNADGDANQTYISIAGQVDANILRLNGGSSARPLRLRRTGDANDRFAVTEAGNLTWLNEVDGSTVTSLRRTSVAFKSMAWDDGTIMPVPRHTSLPPANANRRGALVRLEGAAGVADGVYICLKSAADTYSWVKIADGGA